jgi:hypothetical protein
MKKLLFCFTLPNGWTLRDTWAWRGYGAIDSDTDGSDGKPWNIENGFWWKPFKKKPFPRYELLPEDFEISFRAARGFDISSNRNWCVNRGLSYFVKQTEEYIYDFDLLFFIDADIEFEYSHVAKILRDHTIYPDAVIGGCYQGRKSDGYTAGMFSSENPGSISLPLETTGIQKVDYTGAGFCAIPVSVFKKIQYPFYWTFYEDFKIPDPFHNNEERSARFPISEDCYFCKQCKWEQIPVYADADVVLNHHL